MELLKKSNTLKSFAELNYNISNNILLLSQDKEMLNDLAKLFAMDLVCKNAKPCFECGACKKILNNNAVDVLCYPKAKDTISVNDIDEIVENIYVLPLDFDIKVIILNDFDKATPASQNKLLKSLEEAPIFNKFILTATNENGILPTILSRVNKLNVPNLPIEEVKDILKNQEYAMPIELANNLSGGNLYLTKAILTDKNIMALYNDIVEIFEKMNTYSDVYLYSQKLLSYKDKFEIMLKIFLAITEQLIYSKTGKTTFYDEIAKEFSLNALIEITETINETHKKQKFNANPTGLVDTMLIRFIEVKKLCK